LECRGWSAGGDNVGWSVGDSVFECVIWVR